MKILENNNKSNNLEENLILVETIPIKEYTYNAKQLSAALEQEGVELTL